MEDTSPTLSPDDRKSLMKNEIQKSKHHENDDDKLGASLEDSTRPEPEPQLLMASLKRKSQADDINVSPGKKIKLENQLMACRKREAQRKDITLPNKKTKVENQMDSKEITGPEPQLDDDIIREILRLLPTKSSVLMSFLSKQWQSVWSALPAIDLDFDEGEPLHGNNEDDNPHHNHHIVGQHAKFINMFSWFVGFREKDRQQQQVVEKFRIRMVRYSLFEDEAAVVDKWLRFGLERSVKELDVSLLRGGGKADYSLPGTLFSSKSLTTLKLEHVTVTIEPHRPVSLPSLKTLSLRSVCINGYSSFLSLIFPSGGCLSPALENLSIVTCSPAAADTDDFYVMRMTAVGLRSLEVIDWHCNAITAIAKNLESVTIVSDSAKFRSLGLYGCAKVKYMNVRARRLPSFNVYRFSQSVKEARLDASKRLICRFDNEVCDRSTFLSLIRAKLDA